MLKEPAAGCILRKQITFNVTYNPNGWLILIVMHALQGGNQNGRIEDLSHSKLVMM